MTTIDVPAVTTWQNWLRNESFETRVAKPKSEAEVLDIVNLARSRSETVRAVGTGHSTSPLQRSSGWVISLDELQGVIASDLSRARATVHPGTKIRNMGDPLWDHGLSLTNQGEIDRQAIAGAIATGTHGTGITLKNISSSLRRARIVTGRGEIVEIDESRPDYLAAAQVSLGMLGVMTEIELQLSPAYELNEWIGHVPFEVVYPHTLELVHAHRNFSLFWCPTHQAALNFGIVPDGTDDASDICLVKIYEQDDDVVDAGPIAGYGSVLRRDRSYRVYPDAWEPEFYEMEYMMPLQSGIDCYAAMRKVMLEEFPLANMPVELRFVAADDALLSQNFGRSSAVISVINDPDNRIDGFFERFDELFTAHGGRPHWGKLHFTSVDRLRAQFPGYERFVEIRRELDPDGVFLNDYLRPLFQ